MTYAAYLRIYEPVSAFREPDRSRRAVAAPPVAVPGRESEHAYIRHADGITYVCRGAIGTAVRGERELAAAMYMRAHSRWRAFAEFELAN